MIMEKALLGIMMARKSEPISPRLHPRELNHFPSRISRHSLRASNWRSSYGVRDVALV
jgi:hypothetical protein